jgi:geranylgeranyl pyrophosphate synthase
MDLRMTDGKQGGSIEEIIEMYNLKTSTLIEASLVPLMMLERRPPKEIEAVKKYAYHAGIIFQLRDDILDVTKSSDAIGKDVNNDIGKVNIVRISDEKTAQLMMNEHLEAALASCADLPFNTRLLEGTVRHFAARKK